MAAGLVRHSYTACARNNRPFEIKFEFFIPQMSAECVIENLIALKFITTQNFVPSWEFNFLSD